MKRSIPILVASLGLACAAHAAPLKVDLSGVEARGGKLYISIQTQAQFMKEEGVGEVVASPTAGGHSFTFDVPEGRYAVSVWHDDNDNGEFDRDSSTYWPLDGWAMHNGSELKGPPSFEAVSIDVTTAGATVSEQMIYER